jgi:hypothetical protein
MPSPSFTPRERTHIGLATRQPFQSWAVKGKDHEEHRVAKACPQLPKRESMIQCLFYMIYILEASSSLIATETSSTVRIVGRPATGSEFN